jgi:hypothetical protein
MPLRRIAVERYRCFEDRQELEIFPVTVVLGKNNSGKSALVRAPLIFSTGFGTDSPAPLDLEHLGPESVDGFTDLIFEQNPYRSIGVELEVSGDRPFKLDARIQYVDETRDAFVSRFGYRSPTHDVRLEWDGAATVAPRGYQIEADWRTRREAVSFAGLVPLGVFDLRETADLRDAPLGPMRYLSAQRAAISRQHRLPQARPAGLGTHGESVPAILAHDRVRGKGVLIDAVNRRLQAIVPGWRLDEVAAGPLFATVLRRASAPDLQVNLADAGAGLAQVLPILVQCSLDVLADSSATPPLQIIEEPETHLHPAAHAELAELYLRTAQTTGTRFLVETHSETLLLRLRRLIAEDNEFTADMVGVYVVEQHDGVSTVRRVPVDDLGNLGDEWPEGYFSQDYHEVRALASAQALRGGGGRAR